MAVLVTGGAGYIGGHCVNALLRSGREVVILDNFSTSSKESVSKEAHVVWGDIADEELVKRLISRYRVRAVMHFAALIKVEESVKDEEKYLRVNHKGTRALVRAAARSGVPHFVFSSSAAVYGTPTHNPVNEKTPLLPINPYGVSKVKAERAVEEYYQGKSEGPRRKRGTHVILRYFNVAGADPDGKLGYVLEKDPAHLIRATLQVARGKKDYLQVFGTDYPTPDRTCVRDYIHVVDLAQAHLDALQYLEEGRPSLTLNCGYGHGYSVLEVHAAAQRVTGKQIPLRYAPRRAGDPAEVVADATLIRKELKWKPQFDDLEKMIEHQWKWETAPKRY